MVHVVQHHNWVSLPLDFIFFILQLHMSTTKSDILNMEETDSIGQKKNVMENVIVQQTS